MLKITTEEQREKSRERNRRYRETHPNVHKEYYHAHKEQMNAAVKKWREDNPEGKKQQYLAYKLKVFTKLGGECVTCGIQDHRCLQIDHINSNGAEDRREFGNSRHSFYKRVFEDVEAESKYQLLCANHNWIKRWENKEASRKL